MQSLGADMEGKFRMLLQSIHDRFIIPYIAVSLEAFVFCFAGEYLSSKVSIILLFLTDAIVLYIFSITHK